MKLMVIPRSKKNEILLMCPCEKSLRSARSQKERNELSTLEHSCIIRSPENIGAKCLALGCRRLENTQKLGAARL